MTSPSRFRPQSFDDLIGPAHRLGKILRHKIHKLKGDHCQSVKVLLYGPPGTGKTTLADLVAGELAGDPFALSRYAGIDVDVNTVREWEHCARQGSLFGDWRVLCVHELDKMPSVAQVRTLEFLDKMPDGWAFIGTSNLQINGLEERFHTRFQHWKVDNAPSDEVAKFLMARWNLPERQAQLIAVGSGGNIRSACMDAESALDVLAAQEAA